MILNPCYFCEICKLLDDAAVEAKLEATKRKLQQGYQQAENGLYTTVLHVIWFAIIVIYFSQQYYGFIS